MQQSKNCGLLGAFVTEMFLLGIRHCRSSPTYDKEAYAVDFGLDSGQRRLVSLWGRWVE